MLAAQDNVNELTKSYKVNHPRRHDSPPKGGGQTVLHPDYKHKDYFCGELRKIPQHQRRALFTITGGKDAVDIGLLQWLWAKLPNVDGLEGSDLFTGPNRKDGCVIEPDKIASAKIVLGNFVDAWYAARENVDEVIDDSKLNMIRKMPKIAMILKTTRKEYLFRDFLRVEMTDDYLPATLEQLDFLADEANYFVIQQSRIFRRQWLQGGHLRLQVNEPLPLLRVKKYTKGGSSDEVDHVKDAWDYSQQYARKVIKTEPQSNSRSHIDREVEIVQELACEDHGHHIIRCVKTYERGDEYGILFTPAAKWNLWEMLDNCGRYPQERTRYRSILFQSFGCLSYSLAYIHNVKRYQHRDVKPHNIVFHEEGDSWEFLWTDFGLAYDSSSEPSSKAQDNNFVGTSGYAAPELDHPTGSMYGRSADVFALGCTFLEIISVLAMKPRLTIQADEVGAPFTKFLPYKSNLPAIRIWISTLERKLKSEVSVVLRSILLLSAKMITMEAERRPQVAEIAKELQRIEKGTSQEHLFCKRCRQKFEGDVRSKSKIFQHNKVDWKTKPLNYIHEKIRTGSSKPGRTKVPPTSAGH